MSSDSTSTKSTKKSKKKAVQAKTASLAVIALAIGFLQAASTFYLREIYSTKTLLPSWGIANKDIMFKTGDLMVLKKDTAVRILLDSNLLAAEQARQLAVFALIIGIVYFFGKDIKERGSLLLFIGGLAGVSYHAFLYALAHWPSSLLTKDVFALIPTPIIVPIYMSLLLSALALIGGTYLVFKKG